MARILNRLVTRMLMLAALMTFITMVTGLGAFYVAMYFQLNNVMSHMPPTARAQLQYLVDTNQRGTDRFFDLYQRYGGQPPGITDLGFISVIFLVSILTGGTLAAVVARRISRPITAVAKAAARVSAGDRSVRVDRGRVSGETGELVDSFNRMAADIEAYERERTVLTAGIAHELRTPLTILKGRLHGLADGIIDPANGEADRLLRQVEHLSRLVEDLRTLAHADAGELNLDLRHIDLKPLLNLLVADLRLSAEGRGVSIHQMVAPAPLIGDAVRITQIFTNLLTNAIKHSPEGGRIDVILVVRNSDAIVTVQDQGDGFAAEDAPRLFIPFWRAGVDRRAGRPGSGIGLTLAAKLTEAHDGTITARNRADRSGACFIVSLPFAGPAKKA
ncbi:sensor histidine kinase [Sphingomonas sp. ASY06-1R]|uniref:sensor histidine kinase n=1 Tax=Sphingomonas sp. ASY06-1R TaxID=3445771 RepID=UPI003FA2093D